MNTNFGPARPGTVPQAGRAGEDDAVDLAALLRTLWRGKLFLALVMTLFVVAGAWYAYVAATPTYISSAVVMLNNREEQVVDLESVVGGLTADTSVVNTEVHVLRSRSLMGKVVDELDLTTDPEFNRRLREPSLFDRVRGWVRTGVTTAFGADRTPPVLDAGAEARRTREATINGLLSALSVRNLPSSLVFEIRVETADPEKSARVADTIVELYILNQIEVKYEATEQATDWLATRLAELRGQLEAAEAAVKVFRAGTDLVSPESLAGMERQVKELRDRAAETGVALETARARLERLEAAETPEEKLAAAGDSQLDRLSGQGGSEAAFETRFAQVLQRARLDVTRNEGQLQALQASQAELEAEIDAQSSDLIELQQLTREAEAIRLLYEYFLGRLNETSAQQGIQQADSRALSEAVVPVVPDSPNKRMILALSAVLGLMTGAALLLLRELRQDSFRTAESLERVTGRTVMGQVPKIPARHRKQVLSYLVDRPASAPAEAVRNLRTSLLLSNPEAPPQVVMISSSQPGEGKTTLTLGLAQNMAAMDRRVLVIEGDIRRRVIDSYLELDRSGRPGVHSVMTGEVPLSEAVVQHAAAGIDVLLGEVSAANAADLLSSDRFADLLREVRDAYDHVIIDTPPVLVVPDARIIARQVDFLLFVVGWDRTSKAQVVESMKMFDSVGRPADGVVLNQISPKGMRKYGYGGSYGAYAAYGRKYYTN